MQKSKSRHRFLFRASSIPVLLLLLLPLFLFPLRQMIHMQKDLQIRNMDLQSERLKTMVFTEAEFAALNFTRGNHEFEYQGNMYDVRMVEHEGNKVVVTAMWDQAESAILVVGGHPGCQAGPARTHSTGMFMPYFFSGGTAVDFHYPEFVSELKICMAACYIDPEQLPAYPPPEFLV